MAPPPRMAPPPKPITPVTQPQVAQPNLLKNAASIAGGVAVGNVVGNMATNAFLGSGSGSSTLSNVEQTSKAPEAPYDFQIHDQYELAWVNCLRQHKHTVPKDAQASEHPAIDCAKQILNRF